MKLSNYLRIASFQKTPSGVRYLFNWANPLTYITMVILGIGFLLWLIFVFISDFGNDVHEKMQNHRKYEK